MPLFRYSCLDCGADVELLLRGSDAPACPQCGSAQLDKQLSRFAPVSAATPEPAGCGARQCRQFQGGGCPYN